MRNPPGSGRWAALPAGGCTIHLQRWLPPLKQVVRACSSAADRRNRSSGRWRWRPELRTSSGTGATGSLSGPLTQRLRRGPGTTAWRRRASRRTSCSNRGQSRPAPAGRTRCSRLFGVHAWPAMTSGIPWSLPPRFQGLRQAAGPGPATSSTAGTCSLLPRLERGPRGHLDPWRAGRPAPAGRLPGRSCRRVRDRTEPARH